MAEKGSYMDALGEASSSARNVKHAAAIVAAMTPPARVEGAEAPASPQPSVTASARALAPGAIGAVAGFAFGGEHRVRGALIGHAIGDNALSIIRNNDRKNALCRVAIESSGVVGSMFAKKHPILGWVAGIAAGAAATAVLIKGDNPGKNLFNKLRGK